LTLSQILDRTTPYWDFLTAARSQDRIDIFIGFFLFGSDVVGLSVATCYGASKSYAPTHTLITTIESPFVMVPGWDYAFEQDFEPNCHFGGFLLPLNHV
jgi:hypothetical protein